MSANIIEERGYFWWSDEPVPERQFAPNSAVPGQLKIDQDGRVDLELDGILPPKHSPFPALADSGRSRLSDKSIHGILKGSDRFVSLSEIRKNGEYFTSSGISYEKYSALNALVGRGAPPKGDPSLLFHKLKVGLKGFEEWLMLRGIETKRTRSTITARYKAPKDISYRLDDGTLSIRYDMLGPHRGKGRSDRVQLTELVSIHYASKKGKSLDEMQAQYGLLMDLFTLLTGSDYRLDWPVLTVDKDNNTYQFYFLRYSSTSEAPRLHECWTNFPKLKEDFGNIFSALRKKREELGPGFYLYLGTRRGNRPHEENRFVNLIWGIESLHRRKTPKSSTPSRLIAKIDRILGQIEATRDKKWLEVQLRHADEPSLQERMFDTLNALPLGLDGDAVRRFCVDCAKKRNDISHFGGHRHDEDYRAFVMDLGRKSEALCYLYHAVLLLEIGVDEGILNHFVYHGFRSYPIKAAFAGVGLLPKEALEQPTVPVPSMPGGKHENVTGVG